MKVLIGDIGNTTTKICLVETKNFKSEKIYFLKSSKILSKSYMKLILNNIVKKKTINRFALFSSVVPRYQKSLKKTLNKLYKVNLIEIKNKNLNKIVKVNVKNKNQVGSDRIANAVAAYKKYKGDCIVLDFGTATTFDVITKNGVYLLQG